MIPWFAENLLWASAAMLLVLAIRRPVARWLGAGAAYALWLIPALRLIAPPGEWIAQLIDVPMPSLDPLILMVEGDARTAARAGEGSVPWLPILLTLWAAGAVLFLSFQAFCYRRFLRRLSLSMRSVGHHDRVPLIESAAVEGPLALGLLDRRIVVPAQFEQLYSPAERALALAHERHHHRRGDILANHLALVVLALNWFNPIAWLAFPAFRADQELSCDAAISAEASAETRSDYARALVKSASPPGLIAACPLNGADQLKRRLNMLTHHRKDRRRLIGGTALTASLIAATMLLGAPGYANHPHPEEKEQRRERIIIMEPRGGDDAQSGESRRRERREFSIIRGRDGHVTMRGVDGDIAARIHRCNEENAAVDVDEREDGERTRIVLCTEGGPSGERTAEALRRARERIAGDDEMSAETKQRILAQSDAAIARSERR